MKKNDGGPAAPGAYLSPFTPERVARALLAEFGVLCVSADAHAHEGMPTRNFGGYYVVGFELRYERLATEAEWNRRRQWWRDHSPHRMPTFKEAHVRGMSPWILVLRSLHPSRSRRKGGDHA
jgi:hypothetical protein